MKKWLSILTKSYDKKTWTRKVTVNILAESYDKNKQTRSCDKKILTEKINFNQKVTIKIHKCKKAIVNILIDTTFYEENTVLREVAIKKTLTKKITVNVNRKLRWKDMNSKK